MEERYEDLENIVDTFSVLISEIESKDLKDYLEDLQQDFSNEKEEIENNLRIIQREYEAECRADINSTRL